MVDFTDKCAVLKVSDYADDDRLAKVLTAGHGIVTVRVRGVKKAKAKLKPFAQVFSVFDSRIVGRSGFLTLVEPMLISDGFSLCSDLTVFTAASVAAEATAASVCDEEVHTQLFVEFLRLLSALGKGIPYYEAAVYMTRLSELNGFFREYPYSESPKSPQQMLGFCQKHGYGADVDPDMARRALKFACRQFERDLDTGLKSVDSIDLYA